MDEAMRRHLSRQISGVEDPRQQGDEEFAVCLGGLRKFLAERRRIPDVAAEDASEAKLASWLRKQQAAEKNGALCSVRGSSLREVVGPGWASMR